jgi:hypothetical protein
VSRPAWWEIVLAAALVLALLCALAWLRSRPITGEERLPATSTGPAQLTPTHPTPGVAPQRADSGGPGARLHPPDREPAR